MAVLSEPARAFLTLGLIVGVGPFALAWWIDSVRVWRAGGEVVTIREDVERFRTWIRERRDSHPDDAPVWAEVLGLLVPFGLLLRSASHVFVARLHGLDGTLATTDQSAANAVAAIRDGDEPRADLNGRVAAFVVGIVLWWCYMPGAGPQLAVDSSHALAGIVRAYIALNIGVLFADLGLYVVESTREMTDDNTDTDYGTTTN